MNAKISYTVDLDSVPQTIADLLEKCKKEMNLAAESLVGPHSEGFLVGVNAARRRLMLIDANLSDISAIHAGFLQAKAEIMTAQMEQSVSDLAGLEEEENDE